jgi:hypothetical protein
MPISPSARKAHAELPAQAHQLVNLSWLVTPSGMPTSRRTACNPVYDEPGCVTGDDRLLAQLSRQGDQVGRVGLVCSPE